MLDPDAQGDSTLLQRLAESINRNLNHVCRLISHILLSNPIPYHQETTRANWGSLICGYIMKTIYCQPLTTMKMDCIQNVLRNAITTNELKEMHY